MISRLGAYALASGVATAFMIPPNTDGTYSILPESIKNPLQTFGVDPYTQIVNVPCTGPCPLAEFSDKGVTWVKNQENYLVLNISVSDDNKSLLWNGVQFYPPMPLTPNHLPEVVQVPGSLQESSHPVRLATPARALKATGWTVRVKTMHPAQESGEELIDLRLSVQAIEYQRISIHDITISTVKDKNNELLILSSGISEEAPLKLCKSFPLICQWRGIVADKLEGMRHKISGSGCHKHAGGKMHGFHHGHKPHRPHYKTHHHAKPHHHTSHHHMHHHKSHGTMDKVARIMLHIVIPLLVGILAGMITYLVGMLVGTGLAMAWIKFRRYRRGEYAPITLGEDDVEDRERSGEEKGEFVVESYVEAPPTYIEVEGTEVGQK